MNAAPVHCGTKGCPNPPTEKVADAKLPHVVYDLCASCAAGMRVMQGVELIDARNVPPLTFEPVAAIADRRECVHGYPLGACEVAGCPDTVDSEWEAGEVVDRR